MKKILFMLLLAFGTTALMAGGTVSVGNVVSGKKYESYGKMMVNGNPKTVAATSKDVLNVPGGNLNVDIRRNIPYDELKPTTLNGDTGTRFGGIGAGWVSEKSMEAINGSQLYAVIQEVNALGKDVNKFKSAPQINVNEIYEQMNGIREENRVGGALSSAMAALHTMGFDPDEPSQVMAGVGFYKGKQALAVGVNHYFKPNLMANVSLGLSPNHKTTTMANIGVTYKFGGSKKAQFANFKSSNIEQELTRLKNENYKKDEMLLKQERKLQELEAKLNMLANKIK